MGIAGDSMRETLTVKRISARSSFGDGTRGTALTMAARIERERGSIQGAGGETLDYSARVFTEAEVKLTDLLYFPEDSAQNDAKRPTRVAASYDLDGVLDHYEVLV